MSDAYYEKAQVCLNGHVMTSSYNGSPELRKEHCPECGEETIATCPDCGAAIQGEYVVPGIIAIGRPFEAPRYCHSCGQPYPWVNRRIEAVESIAEAFDLAEEKRQQLIDDSSEIIRRTPGQIGAAARIRKIILHGSPGIGEALREVLADLASEAALKQMGLDR